MNIQEYFEPMINYRLYLQTISSQLLYTKILEIGDRVTNSCNFKNQISFNS